MRKLTLLVLSLVALQATLAATTNHNPTGRVAPADASGAGGARGAHPLAYALEVDANGEAHFGLVAIGSGVFNALAGLPAIGQGLGRDAQGNFYTVDVNNNLVRIDRNGRTQVIGPTGVTIPSPLGSTLVDVFASLADGRLFLMDYSNNLYSVNAETGAATLIGSSGIPAIISPRYSSSLSGDCDNLFFTLDERDEHGNEIVPPTLYRIDPRTGVATRVGPTAQRMVGSGLIDGVLYGFSFDESVFPIPNPQPPHVFSIDTLTGAATLISDLNVPFVYGAVRLADQPGGHCKMHKEGL